MRLPSSSILGIAALAFFCVLPALVSSWVAADFGIYFVYAVFAVSLAFLWGHAGLLSLGHAVYFGIGAYAMSVVTLGMIPGLPDVRSTWLGLLAAVVLSGCVAALVGAFFFGGRRPIKGAFLGIVTLGMIPGLPDVRSTWLGLFAAVVLSACVAALVGAFFFGGRRPIKGAFLGIVTLALAVVIERLAINSSFLGGMNGLMSVPPITLGLNGGGPEITDTTVIYYLMLAILVAVVVLMLKVEGSRFGKSLASVRENELRAATLGHDAARLKIRAFTLSGALAGLAGALFVAQFGFASPSLIGFALSADVLIWVALGGRNHMISAALGAIAVRYLESRLSGAIGAAWPLVLGALFILSVMLFPRGAFGEVIHWIDRLRGKTRTVGSTEPPAP